MIVTCAIVAATATYYLGWKIAAAVTVGYMLLP